MSDQKSQYVLASHDGASSLPSSGLLSPRTSAAHRWLTLRQSAHKFWILEASACLLSIVLFAVIVGILLWKDDTIYAASTAQGDMMQRPHIYPILAILSTVMRATMLLPVASAIGQLKWSWFRSSHRLVDIERFDDAAGGILGSARLLFTLRFRHVAAVGAALTILALPLDALIQSAVLLPSKLTSINDLDAVSQNFGGYKNETILTRAVGYTTYQTMTSGKDVWPETFMVNAIQFGQTFSNGPSGYVTAKNIIDCPTGYCQFEKSQTLAVGSQCRQRLKIDYVPGDETKAAYQTLSGTNLRFYLDGYDGVKDQRVAAETYRWFPGVAQGEVSDWSYEKRIFGYNHGPLIARTAMLLDLGNGTDGTVNNGTVAFECILYWTIKTTNIYLNSTTDFLFNETVDFYPMKPWSSDNESSWTLEPEQCVVAGENVTASNTTTFYKENCVYHVGSGSHLGIQTMLTNASTGLTGNLFLIQLANDGTGIWNERNIFTMNLDALSWNMDIESAGQSVAAMWNNIAFGISATIKYTQNLQKQPAERNLVIRGTVSALVIVYRVDWPRLGMPAFIVLCCALFVLYTALLTKKEYAWRRSALPLLFHGLEDHERFAQGDVRDFNVMQDVAKEIRVRLVEHVDANGARFTTQ